MSRPKLLLLLAPADHPHRDPVCATLAWLAPEQGRQLECYFAGPASGGHFGGGHPATARPEDLRGGTLTGGHHLEQFYRLLIEFEVEAAVLGGSPFDELLAPLGVPVLARSADVAEFYLQLMDGLGGDFPERLLLVGDGGRPQAVPLAAYAYPEIVNRRQLAISDSDPEAFRRLCEGLQVESLWPSRGILEGVPAIPSPSGSSVAEQTAWMARRWGTWARGHLLGDPELAGRWAPYAARHRLAPLFGVPQRGVVAIMRDELRNQSVVLGRQQDDQDFMELSRLGVGFQLVDPGRPAFPVLREAPALREAPVLRHAPVRVPARRGCPTGDPDDAQLERWAAEGRVLTSLLFWTGMIRELENLYALADALSISRLAAGLVLTTGSFEHMPHPPLTLLGVEPSLGGLGSGVEPLLASGGAGAFIESAAPPERFASTLKEGVEALSSWLGGGERPALGWWGVMDAPMEPVRPPRLTRLPDPPYLVVRYRGRGGGAAPAADHSGGEPPGRRRPSARRWVRESPLGRFLEPLRPFDAYAPGPPSASVLRAVRDAGFAYAFSKSSYGPTPVVFRGAEGLTVMNHTVGRWDGWTPFVTVNSLGDLRQAERRLLRRTQPGWLVGTLDTCLWAFSGSRWERGGRLLEICRWTASGGASGRLLNVPPRVVARYAGLLAAQGRVPTVEAR